MTFNPGAEESSEFPGRCLSAFLDEQWPLSLSTRHDSSSSSKEDLSLQLELETTFSTFKEPPSPSSTDHTHTETNERAL